MSELIKTSEEIELMRTGGRILAEVLAEVALAVKPGVEERRLDEVAAAAVAERGAEAAFLGHEGFPSSICISVNQKVVHGIPGGYKLKRGDVVGLDFGVRYKGLITDGAVTVPVGAVDAKTQRLLKATEEACYLGIDQATAGKRVGDVAAAIERHLQAANLGIVVELAGHGVGRELWEEPTVPNLGRAGTGPLLRAGMTIAIEPMATLGSAAIHIERDGWTVATVDGSKAAQFEHTVLVTDGPAEILTQI